MRTSIPVATESTDTRAAWERDSGPALIEIEMDTQGIIRNCNTECESLMGFKKEELVSRHITMLIQALGDVPLMLRGKLNPHLVFICHSGIPFRMKNKAGGTFFSELKIVQLPHMDATQLRLLACPLPSGAKWH